MLTLYSGPLSLFTAKVRVVLAEKAIPYERVEVGWSRAARYLPHHPGVVAINPKRQVPCLVDGDLGLYDSTVIMEYLDDRWPEPPMRPRDPGERARCRLLELEADEVLFPHLWGLIEARFYPEGAGDAAAAEAGVREYHARLAGSLGDRSFLSGDVFGLADVANGILLGAASTLGAPIDDAQPALAAWLARVLERPSMSRELIDMAAVAARG
jgi:glutathione S-transferase